MGHKRFTVARNNLSLVLYDNEPYLFCVYDNCAEGVATILNEARQRMLAEVPQIQVAGTGTTAMKPDCADKTHYGQIEFFGSYSWRCLQCFASGSHPMGHIPPSTHRIGEQAALEPIS